MIKHLAFLIMENYFSDLEFLDGNIMPACRVWLPDHVAASHSIEFIRSGRLLLQSGHGPSVLLDRPALFWHRPGGHYTYGACDEGGWHHHWFTFRGERAVRLIDRGFQTLSAIGYDLVNDPVSVGRLFEQIIALLPRRTVASQARAVCLVEELLALMVDDQVLPDHEHGLRQAMEGLCHLIQNQPELSFDFEREAERLNLSYSHFRRRFREIVGRSPHDYLLMARMYKAVRKLMLPDLSVKQLAAEVGYADPTQFSRMFKRVMGLSPQKFRDGTPGYQIGPG